MNSRYNEEIWKIFSEEQKEPSTTSHHPGRVSETIHFYTEQSDEIKFQTYLNLLENNPQIHLGEAANKINEQLGCFTTEEELFDIVDEFKLVNEIFPAVRLSVENNDLQLHTGLANEIKFQQYLKLIEFFPAVTIEKAVQLLEIAKITLERLIERRSGELPKPIDRTIGVNTTITDKEVGPIINSYVNLVRSNPRILLKEANKILSNQYAITESQLRTLGRCYINEILFAVELGSASSAKETYDFLALKVKEFYPNMKSEEVIEFLKVRPISKKQLLLEMPNIVRRSERDFCINKIINQTPVFSPFTTNEAMSGFSQPSQEPVNNSGYDLKELENIDDETLNTILDNLNNSYNFIENTTAKNPQDFSFSEENNSPAMKKRKLDDQTSTPVPNVESSKQNNETKFQEFISLLKVQPEIDLKVAAAKISISQDELIDLGKTRMDEIFNAIEAGLTQFKETFEWKKNPGTFERFLILLRHFPDTNNSDAAMEINVGNNSISNWYNNEKKAKEIKEAKESCQFQQRLGLKRETLLQKYLKLKEFFPKITNHIAAEKLKISKSNLEQLIKAGRERDLRPKANTAVPDIHIQNTSTSANDKNEKIRNVFRFYQPSRDHRLTDRERAQHVSNIFSQLKGLDTSDRPFVAKK